MGEMRLIDANRVLEDLEDIKNEMDHPIFEKWKEYIDSIPTVDAVHIIRCKDCKYFIPYDGEEHKGDCSELVGLESCIYEYDFCSYGERREEYEVD